MNKREQIQIVLHRGARPAPTGEAFALPDPHGLVKWAAPDRCVITLKSTDQARARAGDVGELIRLWLAQLDALGGPR